MLHGRGTDIHALLMGAQIKLRKEDCALGTGQRSNDAAVKDAQTKLSREEYALSMGHHVRGSDAAVKDAQIKLREEDCALGTGQS